MSVLLIDLMNGLYINKLLLFQANAKIGFWQQHNIVLFTLCVIFLLLLIYNFIKYKKLIEKEKSLQDKLHSVENKYNLFFYNSKESLAILERYYNDNLKTDDFKFLEVNLLFEQLFNVNKLDVLKNTLKENYPNIDDEIIELFDRVQKSGKEEKLIYYASSSQRHFDITVRQISDNQITVVCREVSDIVQSSQDLYIIEQSIKDSLNAIVVAQTDGSITYVNNSFLRMWGYVDSKDVIGHNIADYLCFGNKNYNYIEEINTKKELTSEVLAQRVDKSCFEVLATSFIINKKDSNTPFRIINSFLDITDKKKTEIRLQQVDKFFDTALNIFLIIGKNRNIELLNPAFTKILGWDYDEVINRSLDDFILEDDFEKVTQMREKLFNGNYIKGFESRFKHKDGSYRWILWSSIDNLDEEMFYGIGRDVSEEKDFRSMFKHSLTRLSPLAKIASYGVWLLDKEHKIIFASPAGKVLLGDISDEELGNIKIEDYIFLGDSDLFFNTLAHIKEKDQTAESIEVRFRNIDGSLYWYEVVFSNQLQVREVGGIIVSLRDINKRKVAEEQLRDRETLLSTFIENVPFEVWARDKNDIGILENSLVKEHHGTSIGKTLDEQEHNLSEDSLKKWKRNIERAKNGEIVNEESEYVRDGIVKVFQNILAPIYIGGEIEGYAGFNIDVTDQKIAEKNLRARELLIQAFIKNVPFGISVFDKEGIGALENQFIISNFNSVLNKNMEEVSFVKTAIQNLKDKNYEIINEELVIEKDGLHRIYNNMLIPILSDGAFDGLACISFDETDKRSAEMVQDAQYNIAKSIANSSDLRDIYATVHSELSKLIDASNFYVAFYDEHRDMLYAPYDVDVDDDLEYWSAEKSLTGLVFKRGKTIKLNKDQVRDLISEGVVDLVGQISEVWVGVPLKTSNETTGAIVVQSYTDRSAYNKQSVEVLEIVANQLSLFLERKLYEQKLQESIVQLNTIISNLPLILFAVNNEGIFTFSEGLGLGLVGKKPGEVVGQSFFEVYNGLTELTEALSECLEGKSIHKVVELQGVYLDTWVSPIFDSTGKISGAIGVSSDVTEQIKADKELELSHKSYKSIFNNVSELIFIHNRAGKLIEFNDIVLEFYGYSREELLDQTVSFIAAPNLNDLDTIQNYIEDIFERDLSHTFEFWAKTKMGEIYPFEVVLNKSEYFGEEVIIAVARNVLEQKQAMVKLQEAKEQAEESDMLKTAFLANMSHEIRTPMNAILGFSHLLEENNLDPHEKKEYISLIHKRGHDLLNIINDILDISKIEANQLKVYKELCDLNLIIREVQATYNPLVKEKNIEIRLGKVITDFPPIMTDPSRFQQILMNLVSNAVKFTLSGYVEIGYEVKDKDNIEIYVKDTGVGIPKDRQKLIFERFRQSEDNPLTRQFEGTGLGLTISQGLAQLLGGDINLCSESGVGSTFYLSIPLVTSDEYIDILEETVVLPTFDWSNKGLLVIQDEPEYLRQIVKIFEATQINLFIAETGRKAIEIYRTTPYIDIILLDMHLKDISGYKLAQEFLKLNLKVKIIAIAEGTLSADRKKSSRSGLC